jgi:hypothetical protein
VLLYLDSRPCRILPNVGARSGSSWGRNNPHNNNAVVAGNRPQNGSVRAGCPLSAVVAPGRSTGKRQRLTSTRSGKGKVKVESDDDNDMSHGFSDDNYHDTPSKRR